MSHALATVLDGGRKAASNVTSACLASSRRARSEKGALKSGALTGWVGIPNSEFCSLLPCAPWMVTPSPARFKCDGATSTLLATSTTPSLRATSKWGAGVAPGG